MSASVTVVRGKSVSRTFRLNENAAFLIGVSVEADLRVLNDPLVAPIHAKIRLEDGQWILVRETIRNNLKLNGHKVECPLPLRSGDEIMAGETKLCFEDTGGHPRAERKRVDSGDPSASEVECSLPSGDSKSIKNFVETLRRFAASNESVLLQGETGSGKEVAARAIHEFSARRMNPFVVVNCPALPSSLVESELFGIERGVATGVDPRKGLLETANHGTVFLDEVGDLEPAAQAKLLRFLQERTVNYVGGRTKVRLDVRIIAATHHDIDSDVAAGRFRLDLHHRLKVLTLRVPSLRERPEDIPILIDELRSGTATGISPEVLQAFQDYAWPGNVRELRHVIRSLDVVVDGNEIRTEHLPEAIRCRGSAKHGALYRQIVEEAGCFWELVRKPFLERKLSREEVRCFIALAFEQAGESYVNLARLLHIERDYKRMLDFLGRHDLGVQKESAERTEPEPSGDSAGARPAAGGPTRPALRSVPPPHDERRQQKKPRTPNTSLVG